MALPDRDTCLLSKEKNRSESIEINSLQTLLHQCSKIEKVLVCLRHIAQSSSALDIHAFAIGYYSVYN